MTARERSDDADVTFARLLAGAGPLLEASALPGLIAGVAAAPPDVDPDGWMALVAEEPSPALREALRTLLAEARTAEREGPPRAERLAALRAALADGGVDGFLVPLADEHQSEFPPASARRLHWLTGFGGSAGLAIVLQGEAAIFVDGRYTLQVREQVDTALFTPLHITEQPPGDWLAGHLPAGGRLGYDPWLHTPGGIERLAEAAKRAGAALAPLEPNPIDVLWTAQPARPIAPAVPHPDRFSGRPSVDKREEAARTLRRSGAAAAVIGAPDSIAWLLNLRGGDVPHTPVALGFAILYDDARVALFMDGRKLTRAARTHLGDAVSLQPPDALGAALAALAGQRVQIARAATPCWIADRLAEAGAETIDRPDPCTLSKACKNPVELAGVRAAHRRDGAALCRFLAWLAEAAPRGGLTEMSAADRLEAFRAEGEHFRGLSFDTISGAGPNGAIVHYRVTVATDRAIEPGMLYLVDSGAQYLDGTTDVTRTVAIGQPTAEMRDRFTRVLKGHIAIATARFPSGTAGSQLDALARTSLWQAGLDYDHGTGHGVGAYLGVHEGPHRIAKRGGDVALRAGMIVSNEPGYYKTGEYGIRIENLETVVEVAAPDGGERSLLGFNALTLAPIDLACVDPALLTAAEIGWLNGYHARVREEISPLVDEPTRNWLAEATRAVA
ncbi:MAG: M24 family metallopeptidase [Alphaproteobacteria bacterium]|nr:M24 family metallopeptidase [Alphaproteobacteria bacterium]